MNVKLADIEEIRTTASDDFVVVVLLNGERLSIDNQTLGDLSMSVIKDLARLIDSDGLTDSGYEITAEPMRGKTKW